MRFPSPLLLAVLVAWAGAASAQELNVDAKALDASGAASTQKPRKGKKAQKQTQPAQPAASTNGKPAPGGDRQFGELEGWSPGKSPPKGKDQETGSPGAPRGPLGVTPTGNMSIGLPF